MRSCEHFASVINGPQSSSAPLQAGSLCDTCAGELRAGIEQGQQNGPKETTSTSFFQLCLDKHKNVPPPGTRSRAAPYGRAWVRDATRTSHIRSTMKPKKLLKIEFDTSAQVVCRLAEEATT